MVNDGVTGWVAEGIPSLRGMLRQQIQGLEDGDRLLRAVVAPMARQSRAEGTEAARMVVDFKQTWVGLPEVDMMSRRDSQKLLDRAVTMLIEEYYG